MTDRPTTKPPRQGFRLGASVIVRALRLHQWIKNILVFLPLVAAHQLSAPGVLSSSLLIDALIVFVSFSLCASGTYIINDLCDIEADRLHPTKCRRPFATGSLSIRTGLVLALGNNICGVGIALLFPTHFYLFILAYMLLTLAYSLGLKQVPILDIIILASLYTLRILGAGCALSIIISPWLIAFSMFFFFSLASVKRLTELREARNRGCAALQRRGYGDADLEVISQSGSAGGYISVLVLVLYANDPAVTRLYSSPQILWCAGPVLVYWIGRLFLLANRGKLNADPLVFALRDRVSYYVAIALGVVVLLAA